MGVAGWGLTALHACWRSGPALFEGVGFLAVASLVQFSWALVAYMPDTYVNAWTCGGSGVLRAGGVLCGMGVAKGLIAWRLPGVMAAPLGHLACTAAGAPRWAWWPWTLAGLLTLHLAEVLAFWRMHRRPGFRGPSWHGCRIVCVRAWAWIRCWLTLADMLTGNRAYRLDHDLFGFLANGEGWRLAFGACATHARF